jgi:hypothetical protein
MKCFIGMCCSAFGRRFLIQKDRGLGTQDCVVRQWLGRSCHVWQFSRQVSVAIVLLALIAPANLWATTAAYWRHEDGPSGQIVPDGLDTVLDSSGFGNHMQTFSSAAAPFTAATYSPLVSPLALRSGLANDLSLDFGPNPTIGIEDGADPLDGNGKNDDNYTEGKPIQTQLFTAMTVELAFNMNSIDGYQSLFGKDGKPLGDDPNEPDSPVAPLQIKIRGDNFPNGIDNQLFVEWIDGDGDIHFLASGETVAAGEWNHMAFTLTDTAAELWIAGETGDYVLRDAISGEDFAGPLGPGEVTIFEPIGFSVGRGMFDNNVADWSDALIDEIRVSDTALLPTEFLFVTVPFSDADFDGSGLVTGADFLIWQRNLGLGGQTNNNNGDANADGTVDDLDLADWETQYGGPPPLSSSLAAVPEPTSLILMGGLLAVALASPRAVQFSRTRGH